MSTAALIFRARLYCRQNQSNWRYSPPLPLMAIKYAKRQGKGLSIDTSYGSGGQWKALFELMGFSGCRGDVEKSGKKDQLRWSIAWEGFRKQTRTVVQLSFVEEQWYDWKAKENSSPSVYHTPSNFMRKAIFCYVLCSLATRWSVTTDPTWIPVNSNLLLGLFIIDESSVLWLRLMK